MFEKILVPLDTSPFAEQVIPPVIELSRWFNSAVDLINICETKREQHAGTCQLYLEDKIEQIKAALPGHTAGIKAEMVEGSPGQTILSYAKEERANLIVMSSHGLSGVTLWPLGSTVDKVLRRTGQPILIVRIKETDEKNSQENLFKRILVPLDGSELGARVVPYIAGIASKSGSEVVLFHVIATDKPMHSLGRIDSVPIREDEMSSLKQRSEEYLNREKQRFEGSGAILKNVITSGNVAEEIIKYSLKNSCSLIALSSHGHSGFESWIIGGVTNKILHASRTSMLFVPALES
jgi:nucleotide-binding universal stress UspA family protein